MMHGCWIYYCALLSVLWPCSTALAQECDAADEWRPEAKVLWNGQEILLSSKESPFPRHRGSYPPPSSENQKVDIDEPELTYYILQPDKPVLYVTNFLNGTSTQELKHFCIDQKRFVASPVRGNYENNEEEGGETSKVVETHSIRTSESCTMVPAAVYLSSSNFQERIKQDPVDPQIARVAREVHLSWDISRRAAHLLQLAPEAVEPLQLVRYTSPNAEYKLHHDHGGFYGIDLEHRPWTMLIFLNDVHEGGYTSFPKLNLQVVPRRGDALVWSNVVGDDPARADPDMVHAGEPPAKEDVEKYAVNVWFGTGSIAGGRWS